MRAAGLRTGLVTNQSGVARGMFSEETMHDFNRRLVARLAEQQPHWSVSTPAAAAMVAVTGDLGRAHRLDLARTVPGQRDDLVRRLTDIGLPPIDSGAPFVLLDAPCSATGTIRRWLADLKEHAGEVREGDAVNLEIDTLARYVARLAEAG